MPQIPEKVLPNVPKIGFYDGSGAPEDTTFAACVRAILQHRGELPALARPGRGLLTAFETHLLAVGFSLAAFRVAWKPGEWSHAALAHLPNVLDPAEAMARTFRLLGYEAEVRMRPGLAFAMERDLTFDPISDAEIREAVLRSLDADRPVIVVGPVGPPECGLAVGYEQGGDVLVGKSFFQADPEFAAGVEIGADGYYRLPNWESHILAAVLVGDHVATLDPRSAFLETLVEATLLIRTSTIGNRVAGPAAFTHWADDLLKDHPFADLTDAELRERHGMVHAGLGEVAESRAYGSMFLEMASEVLPEAAVLLGKAARAFMDIHDLVWAAWEFMGGWQNDPPAHGRFREPYVRRRIVPLLRMMRGHDEVAAEALEAALERLGVKSPMPPVRVRQVPEIGYHRHPSPLPGCLLAALEAIGEKVEYAELMGASGAAFRRIWNRDDGGNVDLMYLHPEPWVRLAKHTGFEIRPVPPDREQMRSEALLALRRGRPVIAFGIVGPPEAGLIVGADGSGEVWQGRSYFQAGEFEKRDWFESRDPGGPLGLLILGDRLRAATPPSRDDAVSSLDWAIRLIRTPHHGGHPDHVFGLAAYEAWASAMEIDEDYPDDMAALGVRLMVHCDQCLMTEERRHAAAFLMARSVEFPEAREPLESAAEAFAKVAEVGAGLWPWGHEMGEAQARELANPELRRRFASIVRRCHDHELDGVFALERAKAALLASY